MDENASKSFVEVSLQSFYCDYFLCKRPHWEGLDVGPKVELLKKLPVVCPGARDVRVASGGENVREEPRTGVPRPVPARVPHIAVILPPARQTGRRVLEASPQHQGEAEDLQGAAEEVAEGDGVAHHVPSGRVLDYDLLCIIYQRWQF